MHRFYRAGRRRYGDVLLLCTLGGLDRGVVVVPVVYEQYCLVPLAIACLFAAQGLSCLVDLARERARAWLLVCAILPLLILPVLDLGGRFGHRNDRQLARLRYVFAHTGPADQVLDGWLGTQVFRPHPLYYFFMHRELLGALSETDKDAYLGPLESGKVRPALDHAGRRADGPGAAVLQLLADALRDHRRPVLLSAASASRHDRREPPDPVVAGDDRRPVTCRGSPRRVSLVERKNGPGGLEAASVLRKIAPGVAIGCAAPL